MSGAFAVMGKLVWGGKSAASAAARFENPYQRKG